MMNPDHKILSTAPAQLATQGYWLADEFVPRPEVARLLATINDYCSVHDVPEIHRPTRGRSLRYQVIDGVQIREHLAAIQRLYEEVGVVVRELTGRPLVPLANERVACNINLTKPGGSYRWHYDRNPVTALLYLNEVEGGETECYPGYRILLPQARYSRAQQWLDQLLQTAIARQFRRPVIVAPRVGTLLVMRGDRCLHSVRPVTSQQIRINLVMSWDLPGTDYAIAPQLDHYLYEPQYTAQTDPNYQRHP